MELSDIAPDVQVVEAEYKRLLGFPGSYELDGRVRELADWARSWYQANGKPWVYAREESAEARASVVRVNGTEFRAARLQEQLAEAEADKVFVAAVSAGPECEAKAHELWVESKPDEYFFLEMYGSAVVEHLTISAGARLCAWADRQSMAVLPHYSPGYSGWDVSEQTRLFEVLQKTQPVLPGKLEVLPSGMLLPKKSLLAVFGLTRRLDKVAKFSRLVPCESCFFSPCQFRRTPYRQAIPQLEDVRKLQSGNGNAVGNGNGSVLNPDARYSTNVRALRKWSKERLTLSRRGEKLEARFRYDGTTCSNLGRPLQFDYAITLGSPREGFPIISANCKPAEHDTGHREMCEYLNDPDRLMDAIDKEAPLLGKPLESVLNWERTHSPSGCYCAAESRQHKWGLVFEVLHYALAHPEPKN